MTNMHQAAHAQPEHIVISFRFLYFRYSKLMDELDAPTCMAVLESTEHWWANCDQEVFITAVIANPFYKVALFSKIPLTTHAGLVALFGCLWLCFYNQPAPLNLFTNLESYLASSGEFAYMEMYKNSVLAHTEATVSVVVVWCLSFPNIFAGSALLLMHLTYGMPPHILVQNSGCYTKLHTTYYASVPIQHLVNAFSVSLAVY